MIKDECNILSFDVGIRNLAYVVLSGVSKEKKYGVVESWDVIDLGKVTSVEACAGKLYSELSQRFAGLKKIDYVLIERQPKARSIMMVAIQMFLCMFFSDPERVSHVHFASASRKLSMCLLEFPKPIVTLQEVGPKKDSKKSRAKYVVNKEYAVEACKKYLDVMEDYASASLLEVYKKKDDMCDAFLQAIAFVENDGVCTKPHYKKKK